MKKLIIPIITIFSLYSCTPSYFKKRMAFHKAFEKKNYTEAQDFLEKNKSESTSRTKLLYFLDKGTVEHYLGNYEDSNKAFEEAYRFNDEFTANLLDDSLSFLINPNISQYNGESHEILLIHYFKALNFLFLHDLDKSLVECRRLDQKLKLMQDKYGHKLSYSEDAFMHLLIGIIYQANEEYNNAFIAYRNSLNAYEQIYTSLFSHSYPKQLIKDLIFCAYMEGLNEEMHFYKDNFGMQNYNPAAEKHLKDLVVIWHNGLAPVKDKTQIDFIVVPNADGVVSFINEDFGFCFPFSMPSSDQNISDLKMIRMAIPKYVSRETNYEKGFIITNGEKMELELCENLDAISFYILKERIVWELSKSLLRVALKQLAVHKFQKTDVFLGLAANIASYASEDADTRSWQTFPHSVYYMRKKYKTIPSKIEFYAVSADGARYTEELVIEEQPGLNTKFIEVVTI